MHGAADQRQGQRVCPSAVRLSPGDQLEFILLSLNCLSNYLFCYHVLTGSFSLLIISTIFLCAVGFHSGDELEFVSSHLAVTPANVYVASGGELMDIAGVLACFD